MLDPKCAIQLQWDQSLLDNFIAKPFLTRLTKFCCLLLQHFKRFTLLGTRISFPFQIRSSLGINMISDKVYRSCPGIFSLLFKFLNPVLTLFRMDFGAAHRWDRRGKGGGYQKAPLPKICHTYSTMMKLGTVITYLKKSQKICNAHDMPLERC